MASPVTSRAIGKQPKQDRTRTLADRIREATNPDTMPYGVFGVMDNPYIGEYVGKDGIARQRKPTRKQALFLSNKYNQVFDGFYGGAAGGAKSDAILMAALQFVMVPSYRALIVRKNFKMLNKPGALMERAATWLSGTGAHWNGQDHTWTFPSGAKLTFGHLEHEKNKADYQSANFHFIGIDEVTDLTESAVLFLMTRCRRTVGDDFIPLRFRTASNPLGPGVGWVKRRYVVPVKSRNKASIFRVSVGKHTEDRFFIPASLKDNPYLDQEEYERILNKQDPVLRAQLLNGDWDAKQKGAIFDTSYFEVIKPHEVPNRLRLVRYWDLAGTAEEDNASACNTAGIHYGVDDVTGIDYILDLKKFMANPTDVEATLAQVADDDGRATEVHIEQEPGQSGKAQIHSYQDRLSGYTVRGNLPGKQGSKEVRAKPVAIKAGRGRIKVVEGDWNEDFFIDLTAFPNDGKDTVDALSGAFAVTRRDSTVKSTNRIKTRTRQRGTPNIMYRGERVS